MKLVDFLQGKWLGHPLHPAIVHVPVGAWVAACALDVAARLGASSPLLPRLALYCVLAGLVTVLAAVPTGLAEWSAIKTEKPAWKVALLHLVLNLCAALTWAANLGVRWPARTQSQPVSNAVLLTSLVATAFLLAGGYVGTRLVSDYGIGVARLSKKKWRDLAARGGARLPEPK